MCVPEVYRFGEAYSLLKTSECYKTPTLKGMLTAYCQKLPVITLRLRHYSQRVIINLSLCQLSVG